MGLLVPCDSDRTTGIQGKKKNHFMQRMNHPQTTT